MLQKLKARAIEAAKTTIDQAEGKLDVLVNNAGTFLRIGLYKYILSRFKKHQL